MGVFRLRFKGQEVALPTSGYLSVGRGSDCEIALDDALVSRKHATFATTDAELELIDHGGMNGTKVNGIPVVGSVALAHRDRVQIGNHVFVVLQAPDSKRESSETMMAGDGRATTRRVQAAIRRGGALDAIARAIEDGDVAQAANAMRAIVGADGRGAAGVPLAELPKLSRLLLELSTSAPDAWFFRHALELYSSRQIVPDAAVIDALRDALPRLPSGAAIYIEEYVASMRSCASDLPIQEQVHLRLISALGRGASR